MESRKEYLKDYYHKNKTKYKEYRKKYKASLTEEEKEKQKESKRQHYKNNIDKYKEYRQRDYVKQKQKGWERLYRYNNKNYLKICLNNIKTRAKKRGLDFNIELEDIKTPAICPILGIPIVVKQSITNFNDYKGPQPDAPSVDRIDNTKGYVKGNVQVISYKANSMKSNATPEELLKFAYWVILTYGHLIDKEIS